MERFISVKTILSVFLVALSSWAGTLKNMDPVGAHYEVFRFEKNENPQNILLVYTRLTDSCEFILEGEDPLKPIFDFYWLMDKKDYKVVYPLIKSGIQDRLQVMIPANFPQNRNFFAVKVVDLEQINPSLSEILVEIRSRRTNDNAGENYASRPIKNSPDRGRESRFI